MHASNDMNTIRRVRLGSAAMKALAALFAVIAMAAALVIADPPDLAHADATGTTWAGDQSMSHLSSSLAGWFITATNTNNNKDAKHGPASFKSTADSTGGDKKATDPCADDAGLTDKADKCLTDDAWNKILANPGTAGAFLGFYNPQYSGVPLGGPASASSNASQDHTYKSLLATKSVNVDGDAYLKTGRAGVASFAYYGATLNAMGLDSSDFGRNGSVGRFAGGMVILVLYVLASAMTVLFQMALNIIKWINPFHYLTASFDCANDNAGTWGTDGSAVASAAAGCTYETPGGGELEVPHALEPIAKGLTRMGTLFSGIGLFITVPAIIALAIMLILFARSGHYRTEGYQADGIGERTERILRSAVVRVLVIALGTTMLGTLVTGTLDSISMSTRATSGANELVQTLYVDFANWSKYNALGIPDSLADGATGTAGSKTRIGYTNVDGTALPEAVAHELSTARTINGAIEVPDAVVSGEDPGTSSKPYPLLCGTTDDAVADIAGRGNVSFSADGIVGQLTGDGSTGVSSDDFGSSSTSCLSSVPMLSSYQATLGLITNYMTGAKVSAADYETYVNSVIQGYKNDRGDTDKHNYTPASMFIAPDWAGDTSTAMNTSDAFAYCKVNASSGSGSGSRAAKPAKCDGGISFLMPTMNGLINLGGTTNGGVYLDGAEPTGLKMEHPYKVYGAGSTGSGAPGSPSSPDAGDAESAGTRDDTMYYFRTADPKSTKSIYCDLKPLQAAKPDGGAALTQCNLSPLAVYNYLSSSFDASKVSVYSMGNSTSTTQVPYHYAISRIGTGVDGYVNTLYIGSLLGVMVLIGLGLLIPLLIDSFRKSGQILVSMPGTMLGLKGSAARFMVSGLTMAALIVVTFLAYMATSAAISYVPDLVNAGFDQLSNFIDSHLKGAIGASSTLNIGTISMVVKALISLVLIMLALWMLRLRDAIVTGLSDGIADLTAKVFGVSADKVASSASSTSAVSSVVKAAQATGMAAGAGLALGLGGQLGDMNDMNAMAADAAGKVKGLTDEGLKRMGAGAGSDENRDAMGLGTDGLGRDGRDGLDANANRDANRGMASDRANSEGLGANGLRDRMADDGADMGRDGSVSNAADRNLYGDEDRTAYGADRNAYGDGDRDAAGDAMAGRRIDPATGRPMADMPSDNPSSANLATDGTASSSANRTDVSDASEAFGRQSATGQGADPGLGRDAAAQQSLPQVGLGSGQDAPADMPSSAGMGTMADKTRDATMAGRRGADELTGTRLHAGETTPGTAMDASSADAPAATPASAGLGTGSDAGMGLGQNAGASAGTGLDSGLGRDSGLPTQPGASSGANAGVATPASAGLGTTAGMPSTAGTGATNGVGLMDGMDAGTAMPASAGIGVTDGTSLTSGAGVPSVTGVGSPAGAVFGASAGTPSGTPVGSAPGATSGAPVSADASAGLGVVGADGLIGMGAPRPAEVGVGAPAGIPTGTPASAGMSIPASAGIGTSAGVPTIAGASADMGAAASAGAPVPAAAGIGTSAGVPTGIPAAASTPITASAGIGTSAGVPLAAGASTPVVASADMGAANGAPMAVPAMARASAAIASAGSASAAPGAMMGAMGADAAPVVVSGGASVGSPVMTGAMGAASAPVVVSGGADAAPGAVMGAMGTSAAPAVVSGGASAASGTIGVAGVGASAPAVASGSESASSVMMGAMGAAAPAAAPTASAGAAPVMMGAMGAAAPAAAPAALAGAAPVMMGAAPTPIVTGGAGASPAPVAMPAASAGAAPVVVTGGGANAAAPVVLGVAGAGAAPMVAPGASAGTGIADIGVPTGSVAPAETPVVRPDSIASGN